MISVSRACLAISLLTAGGLCPAISDASEPPVLAGSSAPQRIPRLSDQVEVDGALDEAAWAHAWSMELKYEVLPGENIPPPVRTVVLAFYDDEAVNFAFRAYDPEPEQIRAHLSDRDNIGPDDWVLMILDTFNDERRSFGFMVNPLGVQSDFIEAENSNGAGNAWDAIWDSAAQITDWGYVVEIRIPFSSLRFQRVNGPQIWGIDAIRSYPRRARHHITLFPRQRDNNCYLCQAVKVEGFEGAESGLNLEITPTVTAAREEVRSDWPAGDFGGGETDGDAGLTLRWGMTPNLTLAGTVNPDFSQVEADALQSDINTRFALFTREKRPFFMDGADFFDTPLNVFYTRTMIDPAWGAKLSGKEGPHTIGAYIVRDEVTNLLFPGPESSSAPDELPQFASTAGVLRYKRDIDSRYSIGGLVTARAGDDYSNLIYGVDGRLRPTQKDELTFQYVRSSTEYPTDLAGEFGQPDSRFDDAALDVFYAHRARYHSVWAAYRDVGEGFRSDLGFMPQVGMRYGVFGGGRTWIAGEDVTAYTQMRVEAEGIRVERQDGSLLEEKLRTLFNYEGPYQMHSLIRVETGREGFSGAEFDRDQVLLHHCMKPTGHTFFAVNVWFGDAVDYVGLRQARIVRFRPMLIQRIGRHLSLDLTYTHEKLEIDQGELYTAQLGSATIAYQFNPRLFARVILQHVDYDYNEPLYPEDWEDEEYRSLLSQVLVSYKINPRTVFFLGYSDFSVGNDQIELTRTQRRYFAKIGYAWTL